MVPRLAQSILEAALRCSDVLVGGCHHVGKSRTGVPGRGVGARGIASRALLELKGSEEAVRTETAIVDVVWLVVRGDGVVCLLL